MQSPERSRSARERHIARLFRMLADDVLRRAPREIWEWPALGDAVDFADRRLQRVANGYEEGTAAKDEVLEAANALRAAWVNAIDGYRRERGPQPTA